MNELIDRFLQLPARQRILFSVTAVAGLIFLYLSNFYWPLSTEIEEKQQNSDILRMDRDRKKAMVSNLDQMRKMVADLGADLKRATAALPDKKEIPDLLSSISSLGRETGLEILVFRQRPEQFQEFYAEVPVEVRVQGTYHQLGTFFDKVGHLNRIVNVGEIGMKQPHVQGDSVLIDAACAATTYRFLDEAERARIAKEREKQKGAQK